MITDTQTRTSERGAKGPANENEVRGLVYFELVKNVSRCTTAAALQRACERLTISLGFNFYLFGGYFPAIKEIVVSSSYPSDWRARYDERGYVAHDPIVRHCWTESRPVRWEDVRFSAGKAGVAERQLMREARAYGLRAGISLPIHGSGAEGGMLSLVSTGDREDVEAHDVYGLFMIAHAVHDAARRLLATPPSDTQKGGEPLTAREAECLGWIAKGKTSWETGKILRLSENTVVFHLRNAVRKLEATNRSQAVAKAISLSKITPF